MAASWSFYRGLLIGAGLMYMIDPNAGGGRRHAVARDKALLAGIVGAAIVAYGASRLAHGRRDEMPSYMRELLETPDFAPSA